MSKGGFKKRIAHAAGCIMTRDTDSRSFDDNFEMHDGALVVTALMRMARNSDELKWGIMHLYRDRDSWDDVPWHKTAAQYAHIADAGLANEAARVRRDAAKAAQRWLMEQSGQGVLI